jgi:hypothetical protein
MIKMPNSTFWELKWLKQKYIVYTAMKI